jgi:hypothetical protein
MASRHIVLSIKTDKLDRRFIHFIHASVVELSSWSDGIMQLANFDLRMTAGRRRYPIRFRVSGYSRKSYFTLTTVPGLASLTLSPEGSLSYIYPNRNPKFGTRLKI